MTTNRKTEAGIGTKVVWAGEKAVRAHRGTQIPVVVSVAYEYDDMDEWYEVAIGKKPGHIYSRNTNPNQFFHGNGCG